jgi:hypothetical protein
MLKNRGWRRRAARVFHLGVGVDLEAVYDLFFYLKKYVIEIMS